MSPESLKSFQSQGSNLGMAIPGATFSGDIAALDGKLVKVGKQVRQSGCVRFGASIHLARIILAAMNFDPRARAVMNLRLEALPDCVVKDLVATKIDQNLTPLGITSKNLRTGTFEDIATVLPDVIFDKDQLDTDHVYWLMGCSATHVAHKAVRFARLLEGREDINWWLKEAQRIDLIGVLIMGSVKPSYIKNFAMDLLRTYESSFSPDFEANKLKVSEYTDIKNKNIRNRVAGYISNVMRQRTTRRGEVEVDV